MRVLIIIFYEISILIFIFLLEPIISDKSTTIENQSCQPFRLLKSHESLKAFHVFYTS